MTRRQRQSNTGESRNSSPFDVYLRRHGTCAICRERDEARHHGAAHCAGNFRRQQPTCTWDGRKPKFTPDLVRISQIDTGLTS